MRILILHLDLGIGGAEQLIVNIAAIIKQDLHHDITILTTHHDPNHCFEITKSDGYLGKIIHVYGDWLPRHLFGKCTALFGMFRMIYLAIIVILFYHSIDLVILDGISFPIPLLTLFKYKVLFYCHFPDLLLCTNRKGISKQYYRYFIDYLEEWSTSYASLILVNSYFTLETFQDTFPSIYNQQIPQVLYPVVREIPVEDLPLNPLEHASYCNGYDYIFLSLNRFERKKNIQLAIAALKQLYLKVQHLSTTIDNNNHSSSTINTTNTTTNTIYHNGFNPNHKILLVIAGGYDIYLNENVEYLQELFEYCKELGLTYQYISEYKLNPDSSSVETRQLSNVNIIFRTSIPTIERTSLLLQAIGLLYTPDREHFGIVPIEAMSLKVPVIACNSGGPKETIAHGITGYLCQQNNEEFSTAMLQLLQQHTNNNTTVLEDSTNNKIPLLLKHNKESKGDHKATTTVGYNKYPSIAMRENAKQRVQDNFSYESMKNNLKKILDQLL